MLNVTSISKRSIFKVWFYRQPPWHCTNVDMWILVVLLLVLIFLPSVIMSNSRTDYFELFFAFKSTYLNTTAAVAATIESFELSKIVFQSGDLFVGFFFCRIIRPYDSNKCCCIDFGYFIYDLMMIMIVAYCLLGQSINRLNVQSIYSFVWICFCSRDRTHQLEFYANKCER